MNASYHVLYIWHINKNVIICITKYFKEPDQVKAIMSKWYKVCQTLILGEYQ